MYSKTFVQAQAFYLFPLRGSSFCTICQRTEISLSTLLFPERFMLCIISESSWEAQRASRWFSEEQLAEHSQVQHTVKAIKHLFINELRSANDDAPSSMRKLYWYGACATGFFLVTRNHAVRPNNYSFLEIILFNFHYVTHLQPAEIAYFSCVKNDRRWRQISCRNFPSLRSSSVNDNLRSVIFRHQV